MNLKNSDSKKHSVTLASSASFARNLEKHSHARLAKNAKNSDPEKLRVILASSASLARNPVSEINSRKARKERKEFCIYHSTVLLRPHAL
jgi:hypothetical protein